MKNILFLSIIAFLILFSACNQDNKKHTKQQTENAIRPNKTDDKKTEVIDSVRINKRAKLSNLNQEFLNTQDQKKAILLINKYEAYFKEHKTDTININYLYNKAVTEFSINRFEDAISTIDTMLFNYNSKHLRAESMMFKAFIYENKLKNYHKAEKTYQNIIRYFPGTDFAKNAELSLNNLGKNEEELLKELKQKNN